MFIAALQMGEIEGMEYSDLCADMDSHEIDKFDVALKRLATLTTGLQNQVMNELRERTEEAIARAIRSGSYNQGLDGEATVSMTDRTYDINGTAVGFDLDNPSFRSTGDFRIKIAC